MSDPKPITRDDLSHIQRRMLDGLAAGSRLYSERSCTNLTMKALEKRGLVRLEWVERIEGNPYSRRENWMCTDIGRALASNTQTIDCMPKRYRVSIGKWGASRSESVYLCSDIDEMKEGLFKSVSAMRDLLDGRDRRDSVQRFWSYNAQNIRCVRESDYDALEQRLTNAEAGLKWESARNALLLVELQDAEASPQCEPLACSHEWMDDGAYLLVCTACGTQEDHDPGWQDMDSAPRDGTMLRLLVEFEDHSTEDADQAPTIGANNFDNDGVDRWKFAGWCWSHDHFTEGRGIPVGWLPMLEMKTTGIAERPAPMPTPDDREKLVGQLADEMGRLGMCSAADRKLFERIIDADYRKQVAS
ncbi:hypothetical protein LRQ11_23365 [Pseudomonas sp. MAFF 311095]|uniref:Uncharacterized protein n=1 Tax=Pseudomonas petroselini TaxID=2899822 RepID=A0ABS8QW87_9PSED|nr:hypothetical protein [Pseudomonas petroselini]MCD7039696.1 hypothetical protein [Pseudomonas petroselini]MCD7043346.1 hypothetical protein [Pseudomonas petroselini]MCD7067143.1 hypothetical protein [Pseudomonas petroselini]MCD7081582.1 hypothetical protein [Pseudomonas petroselini]